MKIKTLFLICLSLWIGCNNDRSPDTANEIITEALSLELTFGADEQNTLEDFLIVGGWEIVVDDSNNVYVLDENRLKVFYPDGKIQPALAKYPSLLGAVYNFLKIVQFFPNCKLFDKLNVSKWDYNASRELTPDLMIGGG